MRRCGERTASAVLRLAVRPRSRPDLVRLGGRGGLSVPKGLVGPGAVCWLAGVRLDEGLGRSLRARLGCRVLTLDPAARRLDDAQGPVLPVGLADYTGVGRFPLPPERRRRRRAATRIGLRAATLAAARAATRATGPPVERGGRRRRGEARTGCVAGQVTTVAALLRVRGEPTLDLLHLRLHGGEHRVIATLHEDGVYPRVLCVAFGRSTRLWQARRAVRELVAAGYDAVRIDRRTVTLVRRFVPPPRRSRNRARARQATGR